MSDDIVWEEPPPRERKGGHPRVWLERLAPLVERPGEWARILDAETAKRATSTATNLRLGKVKVPPGEWEFAARGQRVYARFLGWPL